MCTLLTAALALLTAALPSADAAGVMGADWVPFGRADLVWVDGEQTSETLVGEYDGIVSPGLSAYGGYVGEKNAWLGSFGVARVSDVTWDGEGYRRVSASAFRPAVDWQRYLRDRDVGTAIPWVGLGAHVTIPQARDAADVYTEEEQTDADEGARALRGRIGGLGARVGIGGDYRINEGLTVGMRYALVAHRGQTSSEDSLSVSWLTKGEAALRLQLEF